MAGNDVSSGGRSRTILWCVPRSGSTALTKCLSFIEGVEVWFEPYCYCQSLTDLAQMKLNLELPNVYKGNGDLYRQAAEMFEENFHCKSNPEHFSSSSIKRFLETSTSPHVFVKDLAQSLNRNYDIIPEGYTHIFLIRHPLRVFASFRKLMFEQCSTFGLLSGKAADEKTFDILENCPLMKPTDLIFDAIYELWKFLGKNSGSNPIVIDGDDLMSNPANILPKFCRATGLPYNESLLKWDSSIKKLDDWKSPAIGAISSTLVRAYDRAVNSSAFLPPKPMPYRNHVTPDVIKYADQMMGYYNEMYDARMKMQSFS